jgi:hypothetical protein
VSLNRTTAARTATVTVTSSADGETKTIAVSQAASNPNETGLLLTPESQDAAAAGETKKFTVESTGDWTAASDQSWATVSPASGSGDGLIAVTVAKNTGAARQATLTVKAGSKTKTATVKQAAAGSEPEPVLTDEEDLAKAVYCIKYAIAISTQYNDQNLRPSSISGILSVSYTASALLDYISFNAKTPLTSAAIGSYRTDVGRRPGAIGITSSDATARAAASTMLNGKYNFDEDPAHILAYFGGFMGSSKFSVPSSMTDVSLLDYYKMITNGDAITTNIHASMFFPTNCYKIIVYGKNTAGKVIGKYIGYSTGSTYVYWCINPENGDYGKSGSKNL